MFHNNIIIYKPFYNVTELILYIIEFIIHLYYNIITTLKWGLEAMGLVQCRVDDQLKKEANDIFEFLGIDMSTAIRIFLRRTVQMRGLPFPMSEDSESSKEAINALYELGREAKQQGLDKLTLEEINQIIDDVRHNR